jgi:hypothetical protein
MAQDVQRRTIPLRECQLSRSEQFGVEMVFTCPECRTEICLNEWYVGSKMCPCRYWWKFDIKVTGVKVE